MGYKLPKPFPSTPNVQIKNVELRNTLRWSFNPKKIENIGIPGLGSTDTSSFLQGILWLEDPRQEIFFGFDNANEGTQRNPHLVNYILEGSAYDPPPTRLLLDYNHKKAAKQRNKKPNFIGKLAKGLVLLGLKNKVNRLEITPANLPVTSPQTDQKEFEGVQAAVAQNEVTHILTIHGMRTKQLDNFDKLTTGIVKNLSFNPVPKRERLVHIQASNPESLSGESILKLQEFTHENGKQLRFYHLHWSPITLKAKAWLQEVSGENPLRDSIRAQSVLSKFLKDNIFIDGFSDVALGIKGFNPQIRELIDTAFHFMHSPDPFQNQVTLRSESSTTQADVNDVVFISSSLGSTLLYNHVVQALGENPESETNYKNQARKIYKRLHTFFMLTNQLPIISFSSLPDGLNRENFARHIYGNWGDFNAENFPQDSLNIVAFNDPNDLLSFPLPMVPPEMDQISVNNCPLNIAKGFSIRNEEFYNLAKEFESKLLKKGEKRRLRRTANALKKLKLSTLERNYELQLKEAPKEEQDKLKAQFKLEQKALKDRLNAQRRDYLNFSLDMDRYLLPIVDRSREAQDYVFQFDVAHEGVSSHPKILELISHGTRGRE